MTGHGWVDVGGPEPNAVAHPPALKCVGQQRDVFVGAEEHLAVIPRRVAVVHTEGLQARIGDDPPLGADRHHGGQHRQRLGKRQVQLGVVGVHQRIGPGLDLGAVGVDVERAGAAARDDISPNLGCGGKQQVHRLGGAFDAFGAVGHHHQVALVAHHPAHFEPRRAGGLPKTWCVGRIAATSGEPDVDVDEHRAHPSGRRSRNRLVTVDCDGDVGPVGQGTEAGGVQGFVGQQQVVGQPGRHEPLDLAGRRSAEPVVPTGSEVASQRGALGGLDVRAQRLAGQHRVHGGQVGLERGGVDQQRRGGQVVDGTGHRSGLPGGLRWCDQSSLDRNSSVFTTTRVTLPAATNRPSSWADTVKVSRRPSTLSRLESTRITAPMAEGAMCSSWTRMPTVVMPAGNVSANADIEAASHHASTRGVPRTSTEPEPNERAVSASATVNSTSPRSPGEIPMGAP